jgi:hypothetical protein
MLVLDGVPACLSDATDAFHASALNAGVPPSRSLVSRTKTAPTPATLD